MMLLPIALSQLASADGINSLKTALKVVGVEKMNSVIQNSLGNERNGKNQFEK